VLARRIGEVAAPTGEPRLEDGFAGHDPIEWPADYDAIPQIPWLRRVAARAAISVRSTSHIARLTAARASLGIVLLACIAAEVEPALVRLDLGKVPPTQPLWTGVHAPRPPGAGPRRAGPFGRDRAEPGRAPPG
jgi:hypothetical protein